MTTIRHADDDTELLLGRAAGGDSAAARRLLGRHRDRLRRMVALRLSPRLASHLDGSDVVQEALTEAEDKLGDYLRDRPMPFYPWLHRLTVERLAATRRRLLPTEADGGVVGGEDETFVATARSPQLLADLRDDDETTPGQAQVHKGDRNRTRIALVGLNPPDREMLVMHYLEEVDFSDFAAILGVDEAEAKMRHLRALRRIRVLINDSETGSRR
jgi:RNA polymerase sigma-70 factor (ECF subfamily)